MDAFFFRVEHDLLRSDSFKALGGSAIKVYLTIGLYSDFGTGWAYPSIRTIAKQGGMSRQTVLDAIGELAKVGLVATSKAQGKSTAYKIIRQAPQRPTGTRGKVPRGGDLTVPESFGVTGGTVPETFEDTPKAVPNSFGAVAQFFGPGGPTAGPKREPGTKEDSPSVPIPGTPFRLSVTGRLLVVADLQVLLKEQGIPARSAERIASRNNPEDVAKVLLNAFYLQSQGKLQNGPGYIRAGLEEGYELLPQVAARLEARRRELETQVKAIEARRDQRRQESERAAEEEAMDLMLSSLGPEEMQILVDKAVAALPQPIVRRNPTLSNPFVRSKVYELAGGEPRD